MPACLTRRTLLGSAGAVVLAGCTGGGGAGPTSGSADPGDDDRIRADTASDEAALIALYDAVIARLPDLADALSPLRDQHAEHLAALGADGPASPEADSPGSVPAALKELSAAERKAADQRMGAAVAASDEELIRLLALISASEASHVAALQQASR